MIDLHLHSAASDGEYPPRALMVLAARAGATGLSLTDHDTISGLDEARQEAGRQGLAFVSGIELSASEYTNLHILGYGFDPSHIEIVRLCQRLRSWREERKEKILSYLETQGVVLRREDFNRLVGAGQPGRAHFACALRNEGYVTTTGEAFQRYLATPAFLAADQRPYGAAACIQAIKAAGGLAVLAHPGLLPCDANQLHRGVCQLVEAGLDGLECFHSSHSPRQQMDLIELAHRFKLLKTAGSDFHGEQVKASVAIGRWPMSPDSLDNEYVLHQFEQSHKA